MWPTGDRECKEAGQTLSGRKFLENFDIANLVAATIGGIAGAGSGAGAAAKVAANVLNPEAIFYQMMKEIIEGFMSVAIQTGLLEKWQSVVEAVPNPAGP